MNKFCIIIPYIGKFPKIINAFLDSARKNEKIDFHFFTDDDKFYGGGNIYVHRMSLHEIRSLCPNNLRRGLVIPYKLCDFKPLFGEIFQQYISKYEFWGYCDVDLILGKLQDYLYSLDLSKYDRLFDLGHLTFYRNTSAINTLYLNDEILSLGHDFVLNTTIACNYDESGMNIVCENKLGERWLHDLEYTDVNWYAGCYKSQNKNLLKYPQLHVHFPDGRLFHYVKKSQYDILMDEKFYIHMCRREFFKCDEGLFEQPYIITHKGLFPFDESKLDYLFEKYGTCSAENDKKRSEEMTRIIRKIPMTKFWNEIKYLKLIGIINIIKKSIDRLHIK